MYMACIGLMLIMLLVRNRGQKLTNIFKKVVTTLDSHVYSRKSNEFQIFY